MLTKPNNNSKTKINNNSGRAPNPWPVPGGFGISDNKSSSEKSLLDGPKKAAPPRKPQKRQKTSSEKSLTCATCLPDPSTYYSAYNYTSSSATCKLDDDDTPSPRGLTRYGSKSGSTVVKAAGSVCGSRRATSVSSHHHHPPLQNAETLTIETRRTVIRDGEVYFEERCSIQFPKNLPANVQVITAQFVPVKQ